MEDFDDYSCKPERDCDLLAINVVFHECTTNCSARLAGCAIFKKGFVIFDLTKHNNKEIKRIYGPLSIIMKYPLWH